MQYNSTTGSWLNKDKVEEGQRVKLVSECTKKESKFTNPDGTPQVANEVKAQFEGMTEPVNMNLNWTTVYALIEAFGDESKNWMGHTLTAKIKDATTGVSIYLVPDGFELARNEDKRWTIRKAEDVVNVHEDGDELDPSQIPF